MRSTFLLSTLLASLVLASSATAFAADEESTEGEGEQPKAKKKAKAPEAAPAAQTGGEKSDHDVIVGKIGIGYLGAMQTPLGVSGGSVDSLSPNLSATSHIVGMRYWFNPGMGFTAGLGLNTSTGSSSLSGQNRDQPGGMTFALKAGLPIAMATSKHYTFFVEPQLALGYASQTIEAKNGDGTLASTTENSGYRLAVGGTAGAEIHFGFIGIPELSLIGSVGLALDMYSGTTKFTPNGGASVEGAATRTSLATFTRENPWNIFAGNIAAIYYF